MLKLNRIESVVNCRFLISTETNTMILNRRFNGFNGPVQVRDIHKLKSLVRKFKVGFRLGCSLFKRFRCRVTENRWFSIRNRRFCLELLVRAGSGDFSCGRCRPKKWLETGGFLWNCFNSKTIGSVRKPTET